MYHSAQPLQAGLGENSVLGTDCRFGARFWQQPVEVQFMLAPKKPELRPNGNGNGVHPPLASAPPARADTEHGAPERSKLNALLTFENFVTGKANQLARAA